MAKDWTLDDRAQLHKEANKLLDENLAPGEPVVAIIRGQFDSAIIGTDRRVFVFKKGVLSGSAFAKKLSSWDYRNITGIQVETGVMGGVAAVQAAGVGTGDLSYWGGGKSDPRKAPNAVALARDHFKQAKEAVAVLRQRISDHQATGSVTSTAAPDSMDQLRKLAELRDAGILTSEEFESKKAELLARM